MALPAFDELSVEEPKGLPSFDELAPALPSFDELQPASQEDVANAAQNSATVAQQALGVLTLPQQFDWSAANEDLDKQRFYESETLRAQAKQLEEQGSPNGFAQVDELRGRSAALRQAITPFTSVGKLVRRQADDKFAAVERPETPATLLSSFLGPGLTANVQPTIEAAGRNFGSAAGGAAGAALGAAATAGTFGIAPFVIGLGSALLGSYAGGQAEEKVLELTETPEETQARQQRAAEDAQAHPASQMMGGMLATAPFFGPSLAQFGRAAAGDIGAIRNIAAAGGIGAGMEVASAALRGETAKAKDIAEAFFMNSVMNEPTKLGRAIGLHPSSEQAMVEEAQQKYRELPPLEPIGGPETGLNTRGTTSTADVFAGVPRKEAPQIDFVPDQPTTTEPNAVQEQSPNESLLRPTETGQEGVGLQEVGQGDPLAEAAPSEAQQGEVAAPAEAPPETPAAASEAAQSSSPETSNKEAVVNAERAARGLDPVIKEARIGNAESIDRAESIIEQNPQRPQEIVARLNNEGPQERTIALEDGAILLVERSRLNAERDVALNRANDENLSAEERAVAQEQFDAVEAQINNLDQAAQGARSTWGRFGNLWQRARKLDFSEDRLLNRARLAKGEPLTAEETTQVKEVAAEVAAEQQKANAVVAKAEASQAEKAVEKTIGEIAKQPDLEPAMKSLADRIIARLDVAAANAAKSLRTKLQQQLGSITDVSIIADIAKIAAAKTAKGAIKFAQWSAEMVRDFGEKVRPYLQAGWEAADKVLDEAAASVTPDKKKRAAVKTKILDAGQQQSRVAATIAARVKEGQSLDDLGNYIDRLTESFVRGGIRDRNALTAAVKEVLEPLSPGITDQKVHELISGYGKSTPLSKDPIKVVKRDLKGQLQQVTKLEKLAAGEPLKKTGLERRTASDEERRLIQQVNAAKKAAGVVTTDPATQLKSTLDSVRTRLANEIKDLTFQIDTGQRPPNKTPIEYTHDIEVMRGLRDRLKETVRELDGPKELTEEERIRITTRGLQGSIAALEMRLAGAEPKAKRAAPNTPEIQALKAKREALRAQVNEINAADALLRENRKAEALVRSIQRAEAELAGSANRPGKVQGPESQLVSEATEQLRQVREQLQAKRDADPIVQQEKMDAAEAAVEKAIKKLDQQLQAGDLSVQRAPSPAASQRLEDLRMQRDAMNRLRNQLRIEMRPKPNPLDVAIKARKSALLKMEADYEARIAAGDFAPRERKPAIDLSSDKDAMDALARVQEVKQKFAKLQEKWKWGNLTATERTVARLWSGWEATKNAMFAFDLSAPLQLAFSMAAHPIEGAKAIGKGVRAGVEQLFLNSQKFANRESQKIANSPNYKNGTYKEMGLDLTLDSHEENAGSVLEKLADLNSKWSDVPKVVKGLLKLNGKELFQGAAGIAKAVPKIYGLGIKASNVAYNAVANHMRARTADLILERWYGRRGAPTKQQLKLIGELVNVATGRGGIKGEKTLSKLLYAPNYYLSLVKQLTGVPVIKAIAKHEGRAARELTEEYVRALATVGMLQGLAYAFGDRRKQTFDPRSSKFGRMVTDKGTEIDITLGRGAYVTLMSQLLPDWAGGGKAYDKKGQLVNRDRSQALLSFAKGRLSREITTGLTVPSGNDYRGKKQTAGQMLKDQLVPLSWRDFDKLLQREGMTRGSFIQLLNLLGVNTRVAE